jgi:aryl-alcohol dehydrogenase-like predicted oxidoreductase
MTNKIDKNIQTIRPNVFQKTIKQITRVGLGGEGALRTTGNEQNAQKVIKEAVHQGITYFDSARVYMDSEVYYGSYWKNHPGKRETVFHTSKSAQRTRNGAWTELTQTLKRLNTPYLDLWQIHDVRDEKDLALISQKGGALDAFVEAREMGLTRHIGVTGHHDPYILAKAIDQWPVDAVLMPVNPVEEIIGGFLTHTLSAAHKKGIAVIGMKVLGGKHYIAEDLGITAGLLTQFALSYDITLAIVGCRTPDEVKELAMAGRNDNHMTAAERKEIIKPFLPAAKKLAFYRGSVFNAPGT